MFYSLKYCIEYYLLNFCHHLTCLTLILGFQYLDPRVNFEQNICSKIGWGTHVYLWRIHFDIWQI